jgi:hypothetical protein
MSLCPSEFLLCCILQLLDASQQWFDVFDFSNRGQSVPSGQFGQSFGGIKGGKPIFIRFRIFLVLDIEPLLSSTLNRLSHLEV